MIIYDFKVKKQVKTTNKKALKNCLSALHDGKKASFAASLNLAVECDKVLVYVLD